MAALLAVNHALIEDPIELDGAARAFIGMVPVPGMIRTQENDQRAACRLEALVRHLALNHIRAMPGNHSIKELPKLATGIPVILLSHPAAIRSSPGPLPGGANALHCTGNGIRYKRHWYFMSAAHHSGSSDISGPEDLLVKTQFSSMACGVGASPPESSGLGQARRGAAAGDIAEKYNANPQRWPRVAKPLRNFNLATFCKAFNS